MATIIIPSILANDLWRRFQRLCHDAGLQCDIVPLKSIKNVDANWDREYGIILKGEGNKRQILLDVGDKRKFQNALAKFFGDADLKMHELKARQDLNPQWIVYVHSLAYVPKFLGPTPMLDAKQGSMRIVKWLDDHGSNLAKRICVMTEPEVRHRCLKIPSIFDVENQKFYAFRDAEKLLLDGTALGRKVPKNF
tara:strand:- start:11740 stop:12321 length:582 start_codon:yes stop_codon:yes gene_type:complete